MSIPTTKTNKIELSDDQLETIAGGYFYNPSNPNQTQFYPGGNYSGSQNNGNNGGITLPRHR